LGFTLCWSEGGVHQVYGLGVPLWRLPFEASARVFGQPAFPDRLAMGLFMALVAYIVLSTWMTLAFRRDSIPEHSTTPEGDTTTSLAVDWAQLVVALGVMMLSLFFAPLIIYLRSSLNQLAEPIVVEHFLGIALVCGLISLARNPRWGCFLWLCALAGLGGLVRPTLVFYGMATVVIAALAMVCNPPRPQSRSEREGDRVSTSMRVFSWRLLLGVCLFTLGGGLLFLTNRARFGSGWEFGHSLNVLTVSIMPTIYSTRFNYPFMHVPLGEASHELFGALFQLNRLDFNNGFYAQGIFKGQSPIIRHRDFSFSTYDSSYAVCVGLSWLIGAWMTWRWLRSSRQTSAKSGFVGRGLPSISILAMWSVLASAPLAVFYLRTPVLASRYMLDFSPAFVAALIGLWSWAVESVAQWTRHSKWIHIFLLLTLVGWQVSEIASGQSGSGPPVSRTWEELRETIPLRDERPKPLPNEYRMGSSLEIWGIPNNGLGWDKTSGQLSVSAIFFVESPEFLELGLAAAPGEHVEETPLADFQAKVGLELLERTSIIRTNDGWIVRFAGPKERRYQQGVQVVALATVSPKNLSKFVSTPTPWILKRLSWRAEQE